MRVFLLNMLYYWDLACTVENLIEYTDKYFYEGTDEQGIEKLRVDAENSLFLDEEDYDSRLLEVICKEKYFDWKSTWERDRPKT